ncbi:protein unc-93 homolog A [Nephila pilipes]|uniref:Protein unc-93 homolog A n=1 Tax=Nephila pilipes TaxID=299642 RepID=A0A8X6I523_NEPPI|nr:protein unc-93 homolog A [Nephila pilipes]
MVSDNCGEIGIKKSNMDLPLSSRNIEPQLTKLKIIKNLALISLSFFLLFTAYDGLSMLQSTMNKKGGIGVVSQAVGYISFCISALLLPKYVIKKLGCKSALCVSCLLYLPFVAANFYPKWIAMMPTAMLVGIGASTLWGSQCTYFNESAVRYAKLLKESNRRKSLAPEFSSNCTNVVVLSIINSQHESKEEKPSENQKSNQTPERKIDDVLRYKCKNPTCANVDEFTVSEIPLNCIQYVKKLVDNDCTSLAVQKEFDLPNTSSNNDHSINEIGEDKFENKNQIINGESSSQKKDISDTENSENVITNTNDNQGNNEGNNVIANNEKWEEESIDPYQGKQIMTVRSTTLESITGLFFGCHGIAYYSAQICSNVISHCILRDNSSPGPPHWSGCSCGSHFCNNNPHCMDEEIDEISNHIRYLLSGVSMIIATIAMLCLILFLDPLKKTKTEKEEREPVKLSMDLVLATLRHFKNREQLCLIPISFFEGMLQGFYTADFTKAYVACAWGASHVGSVSISYGVACVIASTSSGFLVKYAGRKPLFLAGQVTNILMMTFLLLWNPNSNTPYKFHIAAVFFGTVTGAFWSQLLSFYGLLFKEDEEAAFASYYLCSSLGWTTSFLYSDHIRLRTELEKFYSTNVSNSHLENLDTGHNNTNDPACVGGL